ncbi:DinB family protein [Ferruginibacter sp. SUN106]|uniref:DinB family protein n=1 Tax=Ferruginibacter sp. SUN106 TaxID=2978348 RepID=UPI003D363F29
MNKNMGIEINRIVKLFEALQQGDCWIGTNFKETLQGVDATSASDAVSGNSNSIWQLTAHIIYWRTTVVNRLTGSDNPPPFKDFLLPAELNDAGWKQTLHDFEAAYHSLRTALHNIKDEQLDKASPRKEQTFYQLIMGCLQHDAYHLGQMMLLKKNIL